MLKIFHSSLLSKFLEIQHAFFGAYPFVWKKNEDIFPLEYSREEMQNISKENYYRDIFKYFNILDSSLKNTMEFSAKDLSSPPFLIRLKQVHGKKVVFLGHFPDPEVLIEGDALVTSCPKLILSVQTADCVPVLLYDTTVPLCGAIHSGWRGTLENIVQETIDTMVKQGSKREAIVSSIGPCIRQESFEVQRDMYHLFQQRNPKWQDFFKVGKDENHVWFNLPGLIYQQLQEAGIKNIEDIGLDTYKLENDFSSFRRATHQGYANAWQSSAIRPHQLSSIMIK